MRAGSGILRRLAGWVVLASLLFTRLAAAGYVCPMESVYEPAHQNLVSRDDCLNAGGDQLVLCADSFGDGRLWADNKGHPPDGDGPPVREARYPRPEMLGRSDALHPLSLYTVVSAPIYLQTARLRL
ncbi:hypothetical protein ACUXPM_003548 [Ralstonia sp. 151470066-2]|jgi:hypothetical protein|uniref:Uncharacterized protein n=2 Tax=Ralstonia TaxID=48736 RepID=A0AAD2B7E8_9RALS|nr:hypothetical protein LMG18091_03752 [Ralstonia wenshanensis]